MTTHPSDWRNAPSRTQWLALAALIGIVGGVVLLMHFSAVVARSVGPSLIARNLAGETLLANSTTLFLVAADEASATSLTVDAIGLRGPVMSVTSDGADWFIGDDATGMLHRCDMAARKCTAALQTSGAKRIFRRAHRVVFTKERIFLTDSEAHRLMVFDRLGHKLDTTRTGPVELCFPNGIVAVDGALYIADTNNFRIALVAANDLMRSATFLQVSAGETLERANCSYKSGALGERGTPVLNTAIDSANTVARSARPPARQDRVWPASVLRTSTGEWWVIQMANGMRMGDVIRYDEAGRAIGRIALPPEADPIELLAAGDGVLITDSGLNKVHRASLQGKLSGEWGPPALLEAQRGIRATRDFNLTLRRASIGAIGAGVLAAALVVLFELRRQRAQGWARAGTLGPVAIEPAALRAETVWIPLDAEFIRLAQRNAWTVGLFLLAILALVGYLARDLDFGTPTGRGLAVVLGVFTALVLLGAVFFVINLTRLPNFRLGVSQHAVHFESGSGNLVSAPWDNVRIASHTLLIGRHLVPMIDARGRYRFPQKLLETLLLSRLPPSAFIRNPRIVLEALRRGNVGFWVAVLVVSVYSCLLWLKTFQPELMRAAGARIIEWLR